MINRHFTVEEANELIPMLEPVMRSLQELGERLGESVRVINEFELLTGKNGHGEGWSGMPPEVFEPRKEIETRLLYLHEIGVHVKDIPSGILDFPTRMGGREVYLCWRLGEKAVAFWHEIDSGFSDRRML